MKTLLLFLFVSTAAFSQVTVGYQKHVIDTPDSLTTATVKEFYWWADRHRIDYETKLPELKAVRVVPMNKIKMHYYDRGVIYINSYADSYPFTKRILILHELGLFYGAKATGGSSYDVMNENFILNDLTEEKYTYRKKHFTDMIKLMAELEITSNLKTK